MVEVVDSIIAELIARDQGYVATFERATKAHREFTASVPKKSSFESAFSTAEIDQYTNRHKKASGDIAVASEQTATRVKRAKKQTVDIEVAEDARAVASAKKAADAAIAEAEREAAAKTRISTMVTRSLAEQDARRGSTRTGPLPSAPSEPGLAAAQMAIMRQTVVPGAAGPAVAGESEVNHLLADRATLQANLAVAKGAEKAAIREQLADIRLENQLRSAGVADEEILLRLEERRALVAAENAAIAKKQASAGLVKTGEQFARGAGAYAALGGAPAIAGLAAVAVAGGVYSAAKEGLDYANELKTVSAQLGITTRDLQIYQTGAEKVGVATEQLRTAFGQLSNNLGKAQEGAEQQAKIFGKNGLNIDIGNARDGYKSLSDVLPTVVDRLSAIKDPARRAAIETALFGESGRKLDALLSGGTDSIKNLGDELERTGGILSGEDINRSAKVAADLKRLGDQLERQLASTVSQNAAAIETLATSLLNGASALLKFVSAFERFRAQNQINTGIPELVARGQASLNSTPEGRQQRFRENSEALLALRNAANHPDQPIVRVGNGIGTNDPLGIGKSFVANSPEARAKAREQLLAQRRETLIAGGLANAAEGLVAAVQPGKPGNLNVFAPKGRKGPKGKSPESIEAERLERDRRYTAAVEQQQAERLTLLSSLTADTREQDQNQRDIITLEAEAKDREIRDQAEATINRQKLKGADAAEERARAEAVVILNDNNAQLKLRKVNRDELARFEAEELATAKVASNIRSDELSARIALATTAAERLKLEKQQLAASIEDERRELQSKIDSPLTDPRSRTDAITQRDALSNKQRDQERVLDRQNEGPLAQYRHSFDDPATQVQQAVADKLKSVDDAISDAVSGALGVKDPFLKQLLHIFIEQNFLKPLYDALQGAQSPDDGASGGSTGFISAGLKVASSIFGARATGGPVVPGASYLVGERGPEVVRFGGAGNVYPAGVMPNIRGGGGNTTIVQHISVDGRNSVTPDAFAQQIISVANDHANRAAARSGQLAVEAGPARAQRLQDLGN